MAEFVSEVECVVFGIVIDGHYWRMEITIALFFFSFLLMFVISLILRSFLKSV